MMNGLQVCLPHTLPEPRKALMHLPGFNSLLPTGKISLAILKAANVSVERQVRKAGSLIGDLDDRQWACSTQFKT